jgi:carbamoyltransferase
MQHVTPSLRWRTVRRSVSASSVEPVVRLDVPRPTSPATVVIGVSGRTQNAAAAACVDGRVLAFCEQERVSRIRRAGVEVGALPDGAIDAVLGLAGVARPDVQIVAAAEDCFATMADVSALRLEHHYAHALTAFFSSPYAAAAILVCDQHSDPPLSGWSARDGRIAPLQWATAGASLASVYSTCARIFGYGPRSEHRLEALARFADRHEAHRLAPYFVYADGAVRIDATWERYVAAWVDEAGENITARAVVASSVQACVGELLLQIVADLRRVSASGNLCLAGGLFYNTYLNTLVHQSGLFDEVFVPANPGNAGVAVGCAIAAAMEQRGTFARQELSPFLGPGYSVEEMKETLDNCKLSYEWLSDCALIDATVDALVRGRMVGWFQGRMEWGHRALGNRSILASPLAPYALDNLNVYLKQRDRHHAYGLSVLEEECGRFFRGPARSRHMEYEYEVAERDLLRHVMPPGINRLRVQTVAETPALFRALHRAFGEATGAPVLVNTSFNGFNEPIVCSPRDAIRVFFGSGLDMLVLGPFLLRK